MPNSQRVAVSRRRLRLSLRQLRLDRDETQRDVADALDWSPAKLMRIEGGQVGVTTTDLKALLMHYKVDDQSVVALLVGLARDSRRKTLSNTYGPALSKTFAEFLEYEEAARVMRYFHTKVLPGPLQTEEYARAVFQGIAQKVPAPIVERRVQARMARKAMLLQSDAPDAHFIVDESALWRRIGTESGDAGLMLAQLEHLKELAASPNIAIQFVPFTTGAYPAMRGPFVIVELTDPEVENLLYLENPNGEELFNDNPETVATYLDMFGQAEQVATQASELNDVIDQVAAQHKNGWRGIKTAR
jgi:hypothetical protein